MIAKAVNGTLLVDFSIMDYGRCDLLASFAMSIADSCDLLISLFVTRGDLFSGSQEPKSAGSAPRCARLTAALNPILCLSDGLVTQTWVGAALFLKSLS